MPAGIDSIAFSIPLAKVSAHTRQTGVSLAAWYHTTWAMILSLYTDSTQLSLVLFCLAATCPSLVCRTPLAL